MLADSTEAAVRSLTKPTPARIESLVRRIIKDRVNDGQLDQSDLTLADLDTIANVFVRVLTGIFHPRIEYPEKFLSEIRGKGPAPSGEISQGDQGVQGQPGAAAASGAAWGARRIFCGPGLGAAGMAAVAQTSLP